MYYIQKKVYLIDNKNQNQILKHFLDHFIKHEMLNSCRIFLLNNLNIGTSIPNLWCSLGIPSKRQYILSRCKIFWNINQILDCPFVFLGIFSWQIDFGPFRSWRSCSNPCSFFGLSNPIFRIESSRKRCIINPCSIPMEIQMAILEAFFIHFPWLSIIYLA